LHYSECHSFQINHILSDKMIWSNAFINFKSRVVQSTDLDDLGCMHRSLVWCDASSSFTSCLTCSEIICSIMVANS
jgi:hypothetical protein